MALVKWKPTRELEPFGGLKQEVDRLFDDFFHSWPSIGGGPLRHFAKEELAFMPSINLKEEKDAYVMEAELPGMNKEDLELHITENSVTLQGQRKHRKEEKEEDSGYYMMESSYGAFRRTIPMPDSIDTEKVEAKLKDGLLRLKLPKARPTKDKLVEITVE